MYGNLIQLKRQLKKSSNNRKQIIGFDPSAINLVRIEEADKFVGHFKSQGSAIFLNCSSLFDKI